MESKTNKKVYEKLIKQISYELFKTLDKGDLDGFQKILDNNDKKDILGGKIEEIDHSSFNSLLLNYYMLKKDNKGIMEIEKRKLMKRDYINLSSYYLKDDKKKSEDFFDIIVKSKEILEKDILTFINLGLSVFLYKLDGMYFQIPLKESLEGTSEKRLKEFIEEIKEKNKLIEIEEFEKDEYKKLKKYSISMELRMAIIEMLLTKIPKKDKLNFVNYLGKHPYDIILDAGNILHSFGRESSKDGIELLKKIINKFKEYNILVVIHQRHLKIHKELEEILKGVNYYLTPYKQNDDWYQLLAFLMKICPIVSRDKFRDHIFDYKTNNPNLDQFKFILHENTLNYSYIRDTLTIEKVPKYSECIQYIEDSDKKYVCLPVKQIKKIGWIKILINTI